MPQIREPSLVHTHTVIPYKNRFGLLLGQRFRKIQAALSRVGVERVDHQLLNRLEWRLVELLGKETNEFTRQANLKLWSLGADGLKSLANSRILVSH